MKNQVMKNQEHYRQSGWAIALTTAIFIIPPSPIQAQLIPDNSLGAESSRITPNVLIQGLSADQIEGGATRGVNLFHSFRDFNVANGQRVYFANPNEISNILTRVTGNSSSEILGRLGVNGGANLFLLNPNGILFGPNASLDIRGSFTASTANSFTFPNGEQFSATNPAAPPLLTINVPIGLQYGSPQTGQITNAGKLQVGQNLTLSASAISSRGLLFAPNGQITLESKAGDIAVQQLAAQTATLSAANNLNLIESQLVTKGDLNLLAQNTIQMRDSPTTPIIAQAGGNLLVQGNQKVDIFALNHPNSGLFSTGAMTLRSATPVIGDAHYWSGGNFRVEQLNDSLGTLISPNDPVIRASGNVAFNDYTGASLHIFAGGSVIIPGIITITNPDILANSIVENVTLSDGIRIVRIRGNTQPTLDIRAGTTEFTPAAITGGVGGFVPGAPSIGGTGTSANIIVGGIDNSGGTVFLTNQYFSNSSLNGNISITDLIDTRSFIAEGGSVIIDSKGSVSFSNAGAIDSSTFSLTNNAGDITILATGAVSLANESNFIFSTTFGAGKGGDIKIASNSLYLTNGAALASRTFGAGQGGVLSVKAAEIVLDGESINGAVGSGLYAYTGATGNAGNLLVNTERLSVRNGAQISAPTVAEGRGADVSVVASESIQVTGVSPVSIFPSAINTKTQSNGNAGNLIIQTPILLIQNGGQISTGTEPMYGDLGNAGNLSIISSELVEISGVGTRANGVLVPSLLSADTTTKGNGGNLSIETNLLMVREGGSITTASSSTDLNAGNAGDIRIRATELVNVNGINGLFKSNINTLSLGGGNSGSVEITATKLEVESGAGITTSTIGSGRGGNIAINATQAIELRGTGANGFSLSNLTLNTLGEALNSELLQAIAASPVFPSAITAETLGSANAGTIKLNTERLIIRDGAGLSTTTSGTGLAGDVIVNAGESVELIGVSQGDFFPSTLLAATLTTGDAGNVIINTQRFVAKDGAQVSASTLSQGRAGTLKLNASTSVEVSGTSPSGIPSSLSFDTESFGDAGELQVTTPRLLVLGGGQISAATLSEGKGGVIAVNASDYVEINGTSSDKLSASGLYFDSSGAGDARGISINTKRLTVQNGGIVTVNGSGTGAAGDLEINAGSIFMSDGARLTATTQSGEGGNIRIKTEGSVILRRDSDIRTNAFGTGNGGNITFDVGGAIVAVLSEDSDVLASAVTGRGGNIFAKAIAILGFRQFNKVETSESDFIATSQLGIDGVVTLDTRNPQPNMPIPNKLDSPSLAQGCDASPGVANRDRPANRFVYAGRGGLPPNPSEALSGSALWEDGRSPSVSSTPSAPQKQVAAPTAIIEATGWVREADGTIALVADGASSNPSFQASFQCDRQTSR